ISNHYTGTIGWGDGTPSSTATLTFSSGTFTISGFHVFAAAGPYTVTATINHETVITTIMNPATVVSLGLTVQPQAMTKGIAFWEGPLGQNLIKSFGPTATSQTLGQWLATMFPNLYGGVGGSTDLSGFTNAQVAAFYVNQFGTTSVFGLPAPTRLAAEVMATALNIFATTTAYGGTTAQSYGFVVNSFGLGAYS